MTQDKSRRSCIILKFLIIFSFVMASSEAFAQQREIGEQVDMRPILLYLFPFYMLTFLSLSLFILKLIKPKTSALWIYLSASIAIAGGIALTMHFSSYSTVDFEAFGSYSTWIIVMPNVVIAVLTAALFFFQKKNASLS